MTTTDPFVRTARWISDAGNPFYNEERQRDVWHEAAAFGLQSVLWLSLLAMTATVWIVGAPSLPYVIGALIVVGASGGLSIAYAARLGVDVTCSGALRLSRLLPAVVLPVGLVVGMVAAAHDADGGSWYALAPTLASAAAAGLLAGLALRAASKRLQDR